MTMTRKQWEAYAIKKYGSVEKLKQVQSEWGRTGGSTPKSAPAGWAHMALNNPNRHKELSRKNYKSDRQGND
jgi:hypothetical protein